MGLGGERARQRVLGTARCSLITTHLSSRSLSSSGRFLLRLGIEGWILLALALPETAPKDVFHCFKWQLSRNNAAFLSLFLWTVLAKSSLQVSRHHCDWRPNVLRIYLAITCCRIGPNCSYRLPLKEKDEGQYLSGASLFPWLQVNLNTIYSIGINENLLGYTSLICSDFIWIIGCVKTLAGGM